MKKYKLGEITDINKAPLKTQDKIDTIEYLDTSSIVENSILETKILKAKNAPSRAQRRVSHNTIIYSNVRPNLKHYGLLKNPNKNFIVSTGFTTLDIKENMKNKICPEYLFFLLTQNRITNYLHGIAQNSVSSYPSINPSDIEKLIFDFPQIQEQERIARVLSVIDSKIALNKKISHELESMAREIYNYWFVQFDFPNEQGKPYKTSGGKMSYNHILKRPIPTNWEVLALKDRLSFEKGFEYGTKQYLPKKLNENHIRFYRVGDMDSDVGDTYIDSSLCDCIIANENDLFVSFDGSVGRITYAINGTYSSGIRKIYDNLDSLNQATLYFIFNDKNIQHTIKKYATGTNILHASDSIEHLKIAYNEKIFLKFQNIVTPIFEKMKKNKLQTQNLTQLRNELLPPLMNGQVKISSPRHCEE